MTWPNDLAALNPPVGMFTWACGYAEPQAAWDACILRVDWLLWWVLTAAGDDDPASPARQAAIAVFATVAFDAAANAVGAFTASAARGTAASAVNASIVVAAAAAADTVRRLYPEPPPLPGTESAR